MINSFKIGGCPQILHPHGSPWAMIGLPSLHPGPQAFSCCGTWDASEAKKVSRPGRLEPAPMKSPWKKGENQWLKYQIQPTNNVQTWRMGKHMLSDYLDLFGSIWIFGVPPTGIPFSSDLHVWKLHQHRGSNWRANPWEMISCGHEDAVTHKFRGTALCKWCNPCPEKEPRAVVSTYSLNVSYSIRKFKPMLNQC